MKIKLQPKEDYVMKYRCYCCGHFTHEELWPKGEIREVDCIPCTDGSLTYDIEDGDHDYLSLDEDDIAFFFEIVEDSE